MEGTVIQKILAFNMKRLRESRGLTQEALAERADLSRPYVADLERKAGWVSLDVVSKLANGLQCSEAELFVDPSLVLKPSVEEALAVLQELASKSPWLPPKSAKHAELAGILPTLNNDKVAVLLHTLKMDQELDVEEEAERAERNDKQRKKR